VIILLICLQKTVGTPSPFSSLGLTGDLLIKPQLMGIGGKVYSTISISSAEQNKVLKPYIIMSGTSMATPYVAGYVELLLRDSLYRYVNLKIDRQNKRKTTSVCIISFIAKIMKIKLKILAVTQNKDGLFSVYDCLKNDFIFSLLFCF
jgi:subtilisin family serine protease